MGVVFASGADIDAARVLAERGAEFVRIATD
jgi:hypothetical protein